MIVLGLSGLAHAQQYLSQSFPYLKEGDKRICQGLDSAAALIVDGEIIAAAAEERFNGKKGCGDFPFRAIDYCLAEAKIKFTEVDKIAHAYDYDNYRSLFKQDDYYDKVLSSKRIITDIYQRYDHVVDKKFVRVSHHLAHAASCYYPSGFDQALCIIADGMGELDSITVYEVKNGQFTQLKRYPISKSLGIFYSVFTKFLGFVFNADEYKVMGLAPYGDSSVYVEGIRQLLSVDNDNGKVMVNWQELVRNDKAEPFYDHLICCLENYLELPRRQADQDLTQGYKDLAAALQQVFQQSVLSLVSYWARQKTYKHVCLAGGCFLNCKANQLLLSELPDNEYFVQPAAGDDGAALGAALFVSGQHLSNNQKNRFSLKTANTTVPFDPYLGPAYNRQQVKQVLETVSGIDWIEMAIDSAYLQDAANTISKDKIIAWFHGRMEFGPRALGNRSILAKPNGENVKHRINTMVKFREQFRPFAPALLMEDAARILENTNSSLYRYMLATVNVKSSCNDAVASVVHEDMSIRVQLVEQALNPLFYHLLQAVKKLTDYGCVVNTSFNVRGQPLICDPANAISTFTKTGLDYLYIEGFKVWKQ